MLGVGFRVNPFGVLDSGLRAQGLGFGVQGLGFRIKFRV
jgi:hypothetical protein